MKNGKKVVLIAEDEDDIIEIYTIALTGRDFEILQSKNGEEAIGWLEDKWETIDLILLDIVMPIMDGFETLEKIKKDERFKNIPVIVSTNLDNAEDKKEAFGLGADEYFIKSQHNPSELVTIIQRILSVPIKKSL